MATTSFSLSLDPDGACHGFSTADALPPRESATDRARGIVEIELPLPPAPGTAAVRVTRAPLGGGAGHASASAWLVLDTGGSCVAFGSAPEHLPELRDAAERQRGATGLEVAVVRIDVPLPAGSAPARVSLV